MKKFLKSVFIAVLAVAVLFAATACHPPFRRIKLTVDDIKTAELIEYDNAEAKDVENKYGALDYDFSKEKTLKSLKSEDYEYFVETLSKVEYLRDNGKTFKDSPNGKSLKVVNNDGSFVIICLYRQNGQEYSFLGSYAADGTVIEISNVFETDGTYYSLMRQCFGVSLDDGSEYSSPSQRTKDSVVLIIYALMISVLISSLVGWSVYFAMKRKYADKLRAIEKKLREEKANEE